MAVEIRQLKDKGTNTEFVPVTHWDAISNKPTIPSKTSDLANDSGFITQSQIPNISITNSGSGNVVTSVTTNGHTVTVNKGSIADEKVKVSTSPVNAFFPILAADSSNITSGNTYTSIYDSGLKINPYFHSFAEGLSNTAYAHASHAEGLGTQALNEAEHAEGTYNKSNNILNIEFIDLGLPSGTKWAKYNIGATNGNTAISWYGNYYSWAEINARTVDYNEGTCQPPCNWNNCQYANGEYNKLTKYCPSDKSNYWDGDGSPDDLINLEDSDNIAIQTLGGQWTIPTKEQLQELIDETDYEWITDYQDISGLNGYIFRGNGQELFLPAAGYCYDSELKNVGNKGEYWSSSLNEDIPSNAWDLSFYSNDIDLNYYYRYNGFSIRPVISALNQNTSETNSETEMHTLHSVGIGTSDEDRRNAIEIMSNGNVYINGVGNYDGTNPDEAETLQNSLTDLIPITYDDLLQKVNSKLLIPGKKYLITDYITKINNSDFTSLEKKYDGIVCEAISNSKLSKNNCKALFTIPGSGQQTTNEDVYIWIDNFPESIIEDEPDILQNYHDDFRRYFEGSKLHRLGQIEFENESYWLWEYVTNNGLGSDNWLPDVQYALTLESDFEGNTLVDDVTNINRPILYYLGSDKSQIDYGGDGDKHDEYAWVVVKQEKYTYNPTTITSNTIYVEKFSYDPLSNDIDQSYYEETNFYEEGAGTTNEYKLRGTLEWDDNEYYLWELTSGHAIDDDQTQYSWMLTKTADFTGLSLQDDYENNRYCPCYCFLNEDKSEAYLDGYNYNTHEILLIQAVYDSSLPEVEPLSGGGGGEYIAPKKVEWKIGYDIINKFEGHKGTILYMEDEYGNSANFDFKNIKSYKYGFLFGGEEDLSLNGVYKENKVLGELREFSICSEICHGSIFTQNCIGTIYQDLENCEVSYDYNQFIVFDPYHHDTLNNILIEHQKNIEDIDTVTSSLLVDHEDRIRELESKIEQLLNA